MTQLDVMLAARAHCAGRAWRTANYRHRRIVDHPLVLALWQLGAEPFSAAAIGFGSAPDELQMVVAGEPRNRDLAFATLVTVAAWFNPQFEQPCASRETVSDRSDSRTRAIIAPQVIVPNRATIEMLGRLGRRLAYLPLDGPKPADPQLVRFGQHLQFLAREAARPGQQLVISLTDLLSSHWATALSDVEQQSLSALDAFIDPPHNLHGFDAAACADRSVVGPLPDGSDDERLQPLMDAFNGARAGSTDRTLVRSLLDPIRDHYRPLVRRTWNLMWRCVQREASWPEAASAASRWEIDRDAYTSHMDWVTQGGRRRTRETARQAAMTLSRFEDAQRRLLAEEALDDPLRMIPYLLDHKAVEGRVIAVNTLHRELARVQMVRRPLVTIESVDPCRIPAGRELWWTSHPSGQPWVVESVIDTGGGGATITLKLMTSRWEELPIIGDQVCFSIHHSGSTWLQRFPPRAPWTHEPSVTVAGPESLEESA